MFIHLNAKGRQGDKRYNMNT